MRYFTYTFSQLLNFDMLTGFRINYTNSLIYPFLALQTWRNVWFNPFFVYTSWRTFITYFASILRRKGVLGVIPDFNYSIFFYQVPGVFFVRSKWIPSKLFFAETWLIEDEEMDNISDFELRQRKELLRPEEISLFPHMVLNLNIRLNRAVSSEARGSLFPFFSLVDSNSFLTLTGLNLFGNSKSLRSHFFYTGLVVKLALKFSLLKRFFFHSQLLMYTTEFYQKKYLDFFSFFKVIRDRYGNIVKCYAPRSLPKVKVKRQHGCGSLSTNKLNLSWSSNFELFRRQLRPLIRQRKQWRKRMLLVENPKWLLNWFYSLNLPRLIIRRSFLLTSFLRKSFLRKLKKKKIKQKFLRQIPMSRRNLSGWRFLLKNCTFKNRRDKRRLYRFLLINLRTLYLR